MEIRWLLLVAVFLICGHARSQETKSNVSPINVPLPTLGGAQFWTDYRNRDGFRLQQHAVTGHWRLLDEKNVRQAWGTRPHCLSKLNEVRPHTPANGQSAAKHVIVLVHGLMRSSMSMKSMENALRKEGFQDTIRYSYSSSRRSIDDHATALQELLEDWPTSTRISFVGHSMGNIVVRRLLGELEAKDPQQILNRCNAMVMLGPPNQGAAISRRLAPTGLYGIVTGKGGLQLGPRWQEFEQKLATPNFPFAIVAGDVTGNRIQNPLIEAGNDYLVTIDETKLDGATEFVTKPVIHAFLMKDASIHKFAAEFLREHQTD